MIPLTTISAQSGKSKSALLRACRRLGIAKINGLYQLTEEQAAAVVAECRDGPGCPLFGTKKMARKGVSARKRKSKGR
jgi:hypothetical protein